MRYPDATTDLHDLFLFEAKRRVHKDRTVSLHGRLYEVDPILVAENVILRYDPQAPPNRPLDVVHDATPAGLATRLDAYANTSVKRGVYSKQIEPGDSAPAPLPPPRTGSVQHFAVAGTGDGNYPGDPRRTTGCGVLGRYPYCGRKRPSCHRLAVTNRTVRQNRNNVRNPPTDLSK